MSQIRQSNVGSARSTTISTTTELANHWAAIQYASGRGISVSFISSFAVFDLLITSDLKVKRSNVMFR